MVTRTRTYAEMSDSQPNATTQPGQPSDGTTVDLAHLDFHPTCSALRHGDEPPLATYAVAWAAKYQDKLGHNVWFLCSPCWHEGKQHMASVGAPVMWRVVEILR